MIRWARQLMSIGSNHDQHRQKTPGYDAPIDARPAVGAHFTTVADDLAGEQFCSPVTGLDNKSYTSREETAEEQSTEM